MLARLRQEQEQLSDLCSLFEFLLKFLFEDIFMFLYEFLLEFPFEALKACFVIVKTL